MDSMAYYATGLQFRLKRAHKDKMKEQRHPGKWTNNAVPCEDHGRNSSSPNWDICEEDTFTTNTNYATSVQVVKPYAIEEPDDDGQVQNRESTETTPQWQRDLVESMDELQCESDASGSSFHSDQTRGKKRKPASTGPQDSQSAQSPPMEAFHQSDTVQSEVSNVSPKRRCRKSKNKQSKVPLETVDSYACSYETPPGSSGSDSRSTDTSGADYAANGTTTPDGMDVD